MISTTPSGKTARTSRTRMASLTFSRILGLRGGNCLPGNMQVFDWRWLGPGKGRCVLRWCGELFKGYAGRRCPAHMIGHGNRQNTRISPYCNPIPWPVEGSKRAAAPAETAVSPRPDQAGTPGAAGRSLRQRLRSIALIVAVFWGLHHGAFWNLSDASEGVKDSWGSLLTHSNAAVSRVGYASGLWGALSNTAPDKLKLIRRSPRLWHYSISCIPIARESAHTVSCRDW